MTPLQSFLRQETISPSEMKAIVQLLNPQNGSMCHDVVAECEKMGISVEKTTKGFRCFDASFNSETLSALSGVRVHHIPECSSTNTIARQYAFEGSNNVDVVVTDFQTEGRGRLQRGWYSNRGENILFSMIFRPRISAQMAPRCTLLWAASIAQELGLLVKWPNDIFTTEGRKVAGVLCEASFENDRIEYLIAGIGINVHQKEFPIDTYASSLDTEWECTNVRALIFARIIRSLLGCDLAQSMELHRHLSYVLGKVVQVGNIKGKVEAIHDDGTLLIDGKAVYTGDVQILNEI
jgi:biotin-[acetyl-CoA-carboxylase] ligase BirA-like protein